VCPLAILAASALICTTISFIFLPTLASWGAAEFRHLVSGWIHENGPICKLPTETELMARACHYYHSEILQ